MKKKYSDEDYIHNLTPEFRLTHYDMLKVSELGLLKEWKNKIVLHVGCNTGSNSFALTSKGILVIGLDINGKAISRACKNRGKYSDWMCGIYPLFVVGNLADKDCAIPECEGMFCSNVIEHIYKDDLTTALKNLKKALKKGSKYYISVPMEGHYNDPHHQIIFKNVNKIIKYFPGEVTQDNGFWIITGKI